MITVVLFNPGHSVLFYSTLLYSTLFYFFLLRFIFPME